MKLKLRLFVYAVFGLMIMSCNNPKNSDNNNQGNENVNVVEADKGDITVEEKNTRYLEHVISEANKEFPQKLDVGITLTKMYIDGDYVMYLGECDEDVIDIEFLKLTKDGMKEGIKNALMNDDPNIKMLFKICKKANKGLGYKYVGNTSGESVIIRFSPNELQNLK